MPESFSLIPSAKLPDTLLLTYLHRMGRTGNRTPCHRLTDSREVSATVLPVSTISLQWVYFHWIVLKNTTGM